MDRGFYPTTFSGPERPRLGQQPYDRGRGSNDRRGCYFCGEDGHFKRNCPNIDNRYFDSGRFVERSSAGGNGRWSHDSWGCSPITSSGGKEHGYLRAESVRQSGSGRRSQFDYHEDGDFSSQRPRDAGERHRLNVGRGHGVVTTSSGTLRDRNNVRNRDSRTGRSTSHKPIDENLHRGDDCRDNKVIDGELHSGKAAGNGDPLGQSPRHLVAGGEKLRGELEVKEKLRLKFPYSSVETGRPNGNVSAVESALSRPSLEGDLIHQVTAGSDKGLKGSASDMRDDIGKAREIMERTVFQSTRSRASASCLPVSKLPLSVLCEDAAEGLERNYEHKQAVSSSAIQNVVLVEHILSASGPSEDKEEDVVEEEAIRFSSGERKAGQEATVVEPNLSSSGQRKDGLDVSDVVPIVPSSRQRKDGQEGVVDGQVETKLNCPSPCLDNENNVKGKDIEVSRSHDHGREAEGNGAKLKSSGVERAVGELSEELDVIPVCDGIEGKAKRVSRWGIGIEHPEVRDFDKDVNVTRKDVKYSVAVAAEVPGRVVALGLAEQESESRPTDVVSVEEGNHALDKVISDLGTDRLLHISEDNTLGRFSGRRCLGGRDDEPEWDRRALDWDYYLGSESYFYRRGTEPDKDDMDIEGVSSKDPYWEHNENMHYSLSGTPVGWRPHSRDRDTSGDGLLGRCSREGSADRAWDRNGYNRNGRTGLKTEYRYGFQGYGGGYGKVDTSDIHLRDDAADGRSLRNREAHSKDSQDRPGSYLSVCNARYNQMGRRRACSPPSCHASVPLDPVPSWRQIEDGHNFAVQSQGRGWMYNDSQGILHGPVSLTQIEQLVDSLQLQGNCLVQQEGTDDWVTLGHAQSLHDSNVLSRSVESEQQSVCTSPRSFEVSLDPCALSGHDLLPKEHCNIETADQDICPPGTEAHGAGSVDEDYEDFHIDERVESLMEGRTLIPGKEKDIVHEALSIASKRVQQESEPYITVEESPRSHGGFADIGDQWKDGDFGSDVQGLQGFEFDQQVTKVDAKAKEAAAGAGSEAGTAINIAPEASTHVNTPMYYHSESRQELWKWPSRGGDWKVVYIVDSIHYAKGETGTAEKGYSGFPKKMVMNGGRPLCGSKSIKLRDPRKQNQELGRSTAAVPVRLQLPKFALKHMLLKVDNLAGQHNWIHSQHSVTMLKGAMTPKSQGSTPSAHLSNLAKDRPVSLALAPGFKMSKSGKNNLTHCLITGTGMKSVGQAKQPQPSNKGLKVGNLAIKQEISGGGKNSCVTDKHGPLQSGASIIDDQPKLSSDHGLDRRSKPSLADGAPDTHFLVNGQMQVSDSELSKCPNATPFKKLCLSRSLSKEEFDLEGHDLTAKADKKAFSLAAKEGLEKWSEAKELSVVTALGVPVSPAFSVLTPGALHSDPSTMLHLSVTEESHFKGFSADDSPHHAKQLLDLSTEQASSSVNEIPYENGARVVEVEVRNRFESTEQGLNGVNGVSCWLKRKAFPVEDGRSSKQRQGSIQRNCCLENEDSEVERKPANSSPATHIKPTMSLIIEDPGKVSQSEPVELQDKVEHKVEEQNWAALKPSLLHIVFRCLRGDVKTLVNAMATCKSWLAVGERYKAQLKRADLSSVQQQSLDAVLESLPGFGAGKLRRVILKGCSVSPESLGHLLKACPSISAVEITCDESLKELIYSFPNVKWLGDHNEGQSVQEGLVCKQEDSCLKTKSLKLLGVTRHSLQDASSRDGGESDMHPVSDSASKARSPNGYSCLVSTVEETETNECYQDSAVTLSTHAVSDGGKIWKYRNGVATVKCNGINESMKAIKKENGNSVSRLQQLNRKALPGSLHRKHDRASYRMLKPVMGVQRPLADKHSSTSVKLEHHAKSMISSVFEGDKTLEKEMRLILRVMMEADINKCFQLANAFASEGMGVSSVSAKSLDLLVIERKLKGGAYGGGKEGFKAFKEDISVMVRLAFRNDKDKLTYSAAEKIFKLAHQQFASLEHQIAGTLPTDSNNQGKLPGPRPSFKSVKGRLRNHSMLQHRPLKRQKVWDDDGVQKGKFGAFKKGRQGESSSGDVDSDSDSAEHESRKSSKLKKEQSWESEEDSSEEDEEPTFIEEDEEETETEASGSDVPSESEGEDGIFEDENYDTDDEQLGFHGWGARMTKAAMVPPVTRKYVVIEEYRIVADKERVEQKMKVQLPVDYEEKLKAAKDKRIDNYSHLDIPETKDYQPRKKLGEEVLEQEVYGIDPYTHNLLWDTMPAEISGFSDSQRQQFIEERLLLALNREAKQFTGSGKAPMEYHLERVMERIMMEADIDKDWALHDFSEQLLTNMRNRQKDKFVAYRKGLGVVCNKKHGLEKDEFVVEFFGEVYPPWRWYEKQDGIRSLQKKEKDTTPEFYNIFYERPKGDAAGYDILVVDAMHKANFASRLCHSCRPNCEAKITAVNNTYIIGVYTLKPIKRGEELTFDYNSVTESKEEYNNAVCLCGSQGCRGSYLNLTGSGTFEEVILKHHGLLDRHRLLLDSCTATCVTDEGLKEMRQAGLGSCLLSGLPPWVLKYAASLVEFMNIERTLLPTELLKDLELKLKQGVIEGCTEENAEITTEGVYNQRLQNLAITLDKVRHILTKIYKNPSLAPPPLRKLDRKAMVQWIWKRDDSVVNELLQCLGPHVSKEDFADLKQSMSKHVPHDLGTNLMQSLLWLRDELRSLNSTCRARHDAAADLIHIYAYTKNFFIVEDYAVVESAPMHIHPLDLGSSRHSISAPRVWHKTYSKEYVWGQLIGWYKQSVADPGASLAKAARGCLTLPDVSSCYAKSMQHDFRQGYGWKHREKMIYHMEEKPQQKWPTSKFWSQFWSFKNERGLFGSPMLDSVLQDKLLDDQMVEWLKSREDVFVGPWDEQ